MTRTRTSGSDDVDARGTEDLASLHEVTHRFIEHEFVDDTDDGAGARPTHVDRARWKKLSELGWPALLIPEEHGGYGRRLRDLAAVTSVFARHGIGHPLTIVGAEVPMLLLEAGTEDQRSHWLSAIAQEGLLVTTALWDPGHPYETSSVRTSWAVDENGYRIDGLKLPVSYVGLADAFVVLARESASGELALFVVDRSTPGVNVEILPTTTEDPTGELRLDGVRVSASCRLQDGDVAAAVRRATDVGAVLTSADLTTAAIRGLELSVAYVTEREQFGQPLGAFQAVHHHCADMYRDVEIMRVLCTGVLDGGLDAVLSDREVAIAKAKTSTTARRVLEMAHQLHGGVGFYTDYPLELLYRRSLVLQGEYGSSSWHRARLVRQLQADPATMQRNVRAV